jgi:hypothetical protein
MNELIQRERGKRGRREEKGGRKGGGEERYHVF